MTLCLPTILFSAPPHPYFNRFFFDFRGLPSCFVGILSCLGVPVRRPRAHFRAVPSSFAENNRPMNTLLTPTAPTLRPTAGTERIRLIDALRGFALLGIILANIGSFGGTGWFTEAQLRALPTSPADQVTDFLMALLIDRKFITLFSLLFGVGMALQEQRARAAGKPFAGYFVRRMLILILIGCLHAYVLWFGDIIRYYALGGLLLLTLRNASNQTLLRVGIGSGVFLTAVVFILNGLFPADPVYAGSPVPIQQRILTAFASDSYREMVAMNWLIDSVHNFWQDSPITIVSTFGRIVLGYWLGRIGLFADPAAHARRLKQWLVWGLGLGLPSSLALWAVTKGYLELELPLIWLPFVIAAGILLQSLAYISLFVRWYRRAAGSAWMRAFEAVGQLSLTNYLLQTILGLFLFYGFMPGPGWLGQIGSTGLAGIAVGIYGLQLLFSRWWLSRHRQGPVEWAWRKLAYA